MTISNAFSNALSGLSVATRSAGVVSSNIANAMTDGYGVRSLSITARTLGPEGSGAWVTGVLRNEDPILVGDRRQTEAELGFGSTKADFLGRLEKLVGTPDLAGSLSARAAGFEAALASAAASPQAQGRLEGAVDAAVMLASSINSISDGIQSERFRADSDINKAVGKINDSLQELEVLNKRIRRDTTAGRDVSALLDSQARIVDGIAPLVPLYARRDDAGALQLYSTDGLVLLDGRASVLGFDAAITMQPLSAIAPMPTAPPAPLGTLDLGRLTLNGQALSTGAPHAALGGGKLEALFAIRDEWGVDAQKNIDAVARDLTTRFEALGGAPTQPGLFIDDATLPVAPFNPANEVGLAGRLQVNATVRPEAGGFVWRMRDGLDAVAPGPIGFSGFLQDQRDALSTASATVSGGFTNTNRSFAGLAADHLSGIGQARQTSETRQAQVASRFGALRQEETAQGVDTDTEMSRLLQIEQMFAANARVIAAAQEMLDELLRIR